ncbi:MAG TPA: glycosyltransferase family 2 protein [Acidimicrobiales bacterium]|nr:glycosyltransferase family 2 protein [Acidimicrobiales bacterium]
MSKVTTRGAVEITSGTAEEPRGVEVSIVLPCLNEADTIAACVAEAQRAMAEHDVEGEIIVADNGSTDESVAIALAMGGRVIDVEAPGYGSALMGGIAEARGTYVVMGDADASYDFSEVPNFLFKLREGNALVMGCRLPSGGGHVAPGAMPPLHRWIGNPVLTRLARWWFHAPVHDVYCGMRGFTKALYDRLDLRSTGMEFATEMVIKASLYDERITEIPITLRPDGRTSHAPHLKTFRDGWRTLRFFLMYCPAWLFLIPGGLLIAIGALGYAVALPSLTLDGVNFSAHTLLFASLSVILGYQSIVFGLFTKVFAISEGLLPADRRLNRFFQYAKLERGLLLGAVTALIGIGLLLSRFSEWAGTKFGPLNYAHTMRWVIPGATLVVLGFQTIWSSFYVSILGLRRT